MASNTSSVRCLCRGDQPALVFVWESRALTRVEAHVSGQVRTRSPLAWSRGLVRDGGEAGKAFCFRCTDAACGGERNAITQRASETFSG